MKLTLKSLSGILVLVLIVTNCGTSNSQEKEELTITGKFTSKMGVMHNISCYCFNVGFIEVEGGDRVVVCFERMKLEDKPRCGTIEVKGYYEKYTVEEDSKSPCPGGERNIFYANSFICKD